MLRSCCANTKAAAARKRWHMEEEQELQVLIWWEKLQPLVKKFVRETFIAGFDNDDIRQECFLQLHKAMQRYDENTGISFAYYYKVVLCGWRANENKKNRNLEISYEEEQLVLLAKERTEMENNVEGKILIEQIRKELADLEEVERKIILAYYFENKKLKEIALELGIPYKTLEYKKKGAIHKLSQSFLKGI